MNKVILIGRLCADVEQRNTSNDNTVATYRLAVDRRYKREGQPEADFLTCVAFGKNGEFAGKHLHKGMKIAVEGSIQTRTYDDKDGKKVYVTEIIVERQEFCERKADFSEAPSNAPTPSYSYLEPPVRASATPNTSDFEEIGDESDLPF